jgi:hypothetical protein
MEEFLNPKSMITPGVAGGVMMFLVNGLTSAFPEMPPRYLALALAFVIGAFVVMRATGIKRLERALYWVVTSLVIFVVGYGTNHLGQAALEAATGGAGPVSLSSFLPSAQAQDQVPRKPPKPPVHPVPAKASADEVLRLQQQVAELEARRRVLEEANAQLNLAGAQQPPPPAAAEKPPQPPPKPTASFFKKW